MPVDPPILFLEIPDVDWTQEFWGVKYINPEGYRLAAGSYGPPYHPIGKGNVDTLVAATTAHVLKVGQPYRREIDLSRLMSFEKPGVYRVQLTFSNSTAFKRNDAQWTGFFSGEPFSIEITP